MLLLVLSVLLHAHYNAKMDTTMPPPSQPTPPIDIETGLIIPSDLLGGIEKDSPDGKAIHWCRPVAVLAAKDENVRISYPDFIEDGNRLFITETQKTVARVHEIPPAQLDSLWGNYGWYVHNNIAIYLLTTRIVRQ